MQAEKNELFHLLMKYFQRCKEYLKTILK